MQPITCCLLPRLETFCCIVFWFWFGLVSPATWTSHDLGHWLCLTHTHKHPFSVPIHGQTRARTGGKSLGKSPHLHKLQLTKCWQGVFSAWQVVPPISPLIGRTQNCRALIGREQICSFSPSLRLASELSRKRTF